MLRAIAYSIVRNKEDADDVMQTVMMRLIEKKDRLDTIASPMAFLRTCVRNEAVSLWRHHQIAAVPVGDELDSHASPSHDPDIERVENLIYIKAYIKKQPKEVQDAFISYVLDGCKIVDLAKELGMPAHKLERIFSKIKIEIRRKPGVRLTTIIIVIC